MLTRGFCNLCTSVFSFLMQHSLPAACFLPLFLLYIIARSFFLPVAETVLSVPFVAETVDLVSKFGKIFVGAAFVSCNNRKQPLTSRNEAVEDGISAASRAQVPAFAALSFWIGMPTVFSINSFSFRSNTVPENGAIAG